jgi:hypothetical protein
MSTLLRSASQTAAAKTLAVVGVLLLAVYLLLYRWQLVKTHPDEPPVLPSRVPFLGHLLGMATQGGRYVKNLG